MAFLPIGGSLQVQNNLREIYVNGSQSTALTNLGAAAVNGSDLQVFSVATAASGMQAPQALQVQNNSFNYSTLVTYASGASGIMYTAVYSPAITEYVEGMILSFYTPMPNAGPALLNAGYGYIPIYGSIGPLQGNEISNTRNTVVQYSAYYNAWFLIGGGYSLQIGAAGYGYQAPQWGQVLAGNNAQWYNMTGSRALNTTYTNTTGKPISVMGQLYLASGAYNTIVVVNGVYVLYINNEISGNTTWLYYPNYYFTVPEGATYELYAPTGVALDAWLELY